MNEYTELVKTLRCEGQHEDICRERECPWLDSNGWCNTDGISNAAADAIEKLHTQIPKWISMEERSPDENRNYLVYGKFKIVDVGAQGLERWAGNRWLVPTEFTVTHWMPLPEPPKEGRPPCVT